VAQNAGVAIVLVPGFTQTASAWERVLDGMPRRARCRVVAPVPVAGTFEATAVTVGESAGPGVYVGYSMGGRLCLRLALDRPEVVRALVLVSASPGLRTPAERAARVASDEVLARDIERDGVDAFLERWLAQPMFASVRPEHSGVEDRRRLRPEYLVACLRVLGTGAMEPVWDRLAELTMPVLLVSGSDDPKFDAIAAEMHARIGPAAEHVRVPGGHAVLLERPAELRDLVADFARRHG
jgi:2-succinyl-6-hydroxy-2,4-cyclohexadiene-1-carboxylate synthase